MKRILVPLDGSDYAEKALDFAADLSAATGADIVLLTVVRRPESKLPKVERLDELSRKMALDYLNPVVERLKERGIKAHASVALGEPAHSIVDTARQEKADLIAMSTHGAGSTGRFAIGSIALKVLQIAPCPVTMVRIEEPGEPRTSL